MMNEWMNEWANERLINRMNDWSIIEWMIEWLNKWMIERTNEGMNEWMKLPKWFTQLYLSFLLFCFGVFFWSHASSTAFQLLFALLRDHTVGYFLFITVNWRWSTCSEECGIRKNSPGIGSKNNPPFWIVCTAMATSLPLRLPPLTCIGGWSPPLVCHVTFHWKPAHVPSLSTANVPSSSFSSKRSLRRVAEMLAGTSDKWSD